jgi:hypothetical protein
VDYKLQTKTVKHETKLVQKQSIINFFDLPWATVAHQKTVRKTKTKNRWRETSRQSLTSVRGGLAEGRSGCDTCSQHSVSHPLKHPSHSGEFENV